MAASEALEADDPRSNRIAAETDVDCRSRIRIEALDGGIGEAAESFRLVGRQEGLRRPASTPRGAGEMSIAETHGPISVTREAAGRLA